MNKEFLGIIAGEGDLPRQIILNAEDNYHLVIASLNGEMFPHTCQVFELGEIGGLLHYFTRHGVRKICFAGKVPRPNFTSLKLDDKGKEWLKKLGLSIFKGDDGLLKKLISLIIDEGFEIVDPAEFLNQSATFSTIVQPNQQQLKDIELGKKLLADLSKFDVGQGVIIENGLVLGIEGPEGTDALIARCKELRKGDDATSGVLIKCAKVGQTTLIDRPTIGLNTLINLHAANLAGLAINQADCIVLDADNLQKYADQHGLFIDLV